MIRLFLAHALMPLPLSLALVLAGAVLRLRGWSRVGRALMAVPLLLLYLASLPPVATSLLRPLERTYPAFPGDSVDAVVVLGGGHLSDPSIPVSSWLSGSALYRLVEGVRIARSQPWTTLVLSGWSPSDRMSNAEAYREVAKSLGFPEERMVLEARPRNTAQEAELIEPLVRGRRFALVTSASHMPRAAALFRARGLDPVPAPTNHLALRGPGVHVLDFVPDEGALALTTRWWYETLSRTWGRIRGDL